MYVYVPVYVYTNTTTQKKDCALAQIVPIVLLGCHHSVGDCVPPLYHQLCRCCGHLILSQRYSGNSVWNCRQFNRTLFQRRIGFGKSLQIFGWDTSHDVVRVPPEEDGTELLYEVISHVE